ncbi:MAG: hypothetical protein LBC49_05520, partial [Bacteroidales bacterium]|nr:hypothetical protein [Bacteroidales bacterium]
MRYFNIAGPCNKIDHYMIDASERLHGVEELIDYKQYFVIHAARQSGKTTYLQDLSSRLNSGGKYYCLYSSLEELQGVIDPKDGIPQIVRTLIKDFTYSGIPGASDFGKDADFIDFSNVLGVELTKICIKLDRPLIILFDEADCLSEGTMITFLRQLRNGHNNRTVRPFVHSVALVGMRNIRD